MTDTPSSRRFRWVAFLIFLAGIASVFWSNHRNSPIVPSSSAELQKVCRGVEPGANGSSAGHVTRDGQYFYSEPIEVGTGLREALQVLKEGATYETYQAKKCGDFHADFEGAWSDPKGEIRVQVCLTCGETWNFQGDRSKHYTLSGDAFRKLEAAWQATGLKK